MTPGKKMGQSLVPVKDSIDHTAEEGVIYISSLGGIYHTARFDADTMKKYSKNVYGARIANQHRQIIFQEKYIIKATDPSGKVDEELSLALTKMCDSKDVRLWSKMQLAWADVFWYGMPFLNPVWKNIDGEYRLVKLRRLPPETFKYPPWGRTNRYSDILPGVSIDPETGERDFWQTLQPQDLAVNWNDAHTMMQFQTRLENIFTIQEPSTNELAGEPIFLPVAPLLAMLDFSWQSQLGKVNRIGKPIIFMKITNPSGDDLDVGQEILNNWDQNTAYTIRPNMEIIMPNLTDNSSALETINALSALIVEYFTPAGLIGQQGMKSSIGGNQGSELDLLMAYVKGVHEWLTEGFEELLQPYLVNNGYDPDYTIEIEIPSPSVNKSELWLKQADMGLKYNVLTMNEARDLLDQPELDDKGIKDLLADAKLRLDAAPKPEPPAPFGNPALAAGAGKQAALNDKKPEGQTAAQPPEVNAPGAKPTAKEAKLTAKEKMEILGNIISKTPLNPGAIIPVKDSKRFIQKTLGIENGEE